MLSLCLSICVPPPLITLNQLVDFHEIQQEGHAIDGDPDAIIFNFVASAVGPCCKILWHVKERYEYEGYIS
jgi:hypothetical protein